jgi:hypothetical protein
MGKTSPFEFLDQINFGKKDLIRESDNPELMEKDYNAFMINRGLSYFPDTIAFANEMNMLSDLPSIMQNDFYLNIIRKRKRYSKWHKKEKYKTIEKIMEYYDYNIRRAEEALKILTDDDIKNIEAALDRGGVQKNKKDSKK